MIRLFKTSMTLHFWASPYHSMNELLAWRNFRSERSALALKVMSPGFPRDDPPSAPPSRPNPSYPTDVPAPEPHDVPVPEPRDVPPPDPGKVPPLAKPSQRPGQDSKPRPVP